MSQMGPLSTPWSVEETEQDEAVSGRLDVVTQDSKAFIVARRWNQSKQNHRQSEQSTVGPLIYCEVSKCVRGLEGCLGTRPKLSTYMCW